MTDVTRILLAIEQGDPQAAEQLLPLVYDELRKLAAQKLAHEKPGQTLQATALVHEAYLRLVGGGAAPFGWNSRGHFFAAAAEAMRRILVENARRKRAVKHAGERVRVTLEGLDLADEPPPEQLLALDEALTRLGRRRSPEGGAGQAPLLRRPVHRGGRRSPGDLPAHREALVDVRPGLAAPRGRGRRADRRRLTFFGSDEPILGGFSH